MSKIRADARSRAQDIESAGCAPSDVATAAAEDAVTQATGEETAAQGNSALSPTREATNG